METAERIDCPAPLPEGPADALLMEKGIREEGRKEGPGDQEGSPM